MWGQKSSGAVPFGTLFALCFLWFGISVPLVFIGSYFGYKKPAPEDPVRTNKIPRQIPEQVGGALRVVSCHTTLAWPMHPSPGSLNDAAASFSFASMRVCLRQRHVPSSGRCLHIWQFMQVWSAETCSEWEHAWV